MDKYEEALAKARAGKNLEEIFPGGLVLVRCNI